MKTGRFRLDGNAYNDALGDVRTQLTGAAVWTMEGYRDTGFIMPFLIYDQADTFQIAIQMPHSKKLNSIVGVHAHIVPMANGAGDFKLTYYYTFASIGVEIPALASWTTNTATKALVAGDQYKHTYMDLFTFTPTSETVSGILHVKLVNDVTGTYETSKDHGTAKANIGILYLDAHVILDGIGSELEARKPSM